MINTFGNKAGSNVTIQKSLTFLYINNKISVKQFRKTFPTKVSLKIKIESK
jgi:hypothetical protein